MFNGRHVECTPFRDLTAEAVKQAFQDCAIEHVLHVPIDFLAGQTYVLCVVDQGEQLVDIALEFSVGIGQGLVELLVHEEQVRVAVVEDEWLFILDYKTEYFCEAQKYVDHSL